MSSDTMPVVTDHRKSVRVTHEPERIETRFDIGELVEVKGITMQISEVGEQRLVLKFLRGKR